MGPYYDAVSLMIWRLPEPERTPWMAYRQPAPRRGPDRKPSRNAGSNRERRLDLD